MIKLFPQHCACAKPYFAARTGNTEDKELKGEDGWAVLASSQLTHFPLQAAPAEHRDFSFCMSDQQSVLPEGGHGPFRLHCQICEGSVSLEGDSVWGRALGYHSLMH